MKYCIIAQRLNHWWKEHSGKYAFDSYEEAAAFLNDGYRYVGDGFWVWSGDMSQRFIVEEDGKEFFFNRPNRNPKDCPYNPPNLEWD